MQLKIISITLHCIVCVCFWLRQQAEYQTEACLTGIILFSIEYSDEIPGI